MPSERQIGAAAHVRRPVLPAAVVPDNKRAVSARAASQKLDNDAWADTVPSGRTQAQQTDGGDRCGGPTGYDLLHNPRLNKGTAFTQAERRAFGLEGLPQGYGARRTAAYGRERAARGLRMKIKTLAQLIERGLWRPTGAKDAIARAAAGHAGLDLPRPGAKAIGGRQ